MITKVNMSEEVGKDHQKGSPIRSSIITSPVVCDVLFGLAELGYALRLPLPSSYTMPYLGTVGVGAPYQKRWHHGCLVRRRGSL